MTLIPIEHERRLASAAEAESFYRELGEARVSARGFHTTDPARMARLVDAIDPKREHTISFEAGTLGAAARERLDELARARFAYLDVRTADAALRIWPELPRAWVHAKLDAAAASAALGTPLTVGERTLGEARVEVRDDPRGWPIDVKTESADAALRIFHALSDERLDRGFIQGVHPDTKRLLDRLLATLAVRVDAVLDVPIAVARSLTELYAGERLDWQATGLLVDFPDGRIHGFLRTPNVGERDRDAWRARVTAALRRAGLA